MQKKRLAIKGPESLIFWARRNQPEQQWVLGRSRHVRLDREQTVLDDKALKYEADEIFPQRLQWSTLNTTEADDLPGKNLGRFALRCA
jgi:hypothetical protein